MSMMVIHCHYCKTIFQKPKAEMNEHNFCCFDHFKIWNKQRISLYNSTSNPMNKKGGVYEARVKRGDLLRNTGEGKTYRKRLGGHEHRFFAEVKLGRKLKKGEIVHHIDGNKRNNAPENLLVLPSQAEHARIHFGKRNGGDANE